MSEQGWRQRAVDYFAVDDDWVRVPGPDAGRRDLLLAGGLFLLSAVGLELARSGGALDPSHSVWLEYAGLLAMAAPIAVRRRWPLGTAVASALAFFVVGMTMPTVAVQLSVQVLLFYALFSAVAWAPDRRTVLLVMAGILVLMFGWLAWQYAIGSAVDQITADTSSAADANRSRGLLTPVAASVAYAFLVNVVYFGGAVIGGQAAWRGARRNSQLAEQAAMLEAQAGTLREHAVVQERLRIARELHDVVAHHVSLMGVQAGAARRVLAVDPQAASSALATVEASARDAVTEMRALLGTLRQGDTSAAGASRAPEPSVDAIPDLVAQLSSASSADGSVPLEVAYSVVAQPSGAEAAVTPAVGLTLYRTVQEALNNVRRHSTATAASVVLRVVSDAPGGGFAEVEVLDTGRPRTGTSGTGLGLLGMRERVSSLHGTLDIGPRPIGGFRVRVRLPLASGVTPTVTSDVVPSRVGAVRDGGES